MKHRAIPRRNGVRRDFAARELAGSLFKEERL